MQQLFDSYDQAHKGKIPVGSLKDAMEKLNLKFRKVEMNRFLKMAGSLGLSRPQFEALIGFAKYQLYQMKNWSRLVTGLLYFCGYADEWAHDKNQLRLRIGSEDVEADQLSTFAHYVVGSTQSNEALN